MTIGPTDAPRRVLPWPERNPHGTPPRDNPHGYTPVQFAALLAQASRRIRAECRRDRERAFISGLISGLAIGLAMVGVLLAALLWTASASGQGCGCDPRSPLTPYPRHLAGSVHFIQPFAGGLTVAIRRQPDGTWRSDPTDPENFGALVTFQPGAGSISLVIPEGEPLPPGAWQYRQAAEPAVADGYPAWMGWHDQIAPDQIEAAAAVGPWVDPTNAPAVPEPAAGVLLAALLAARGRP